jgi:hypothetical protein
MMLNRPSNLQRQPQTNWASYGFGLVAILLLFLIFQNFNSIPHAYETLRHNREAEVGQVDSVVSTPLAFSSPQLTSYVTLAAPPSLPSILIAPEKQNKEQRGIYGGVMDKPHLGS